MGKRQVLINLNVDGEGDFERVNVRDFLDVEKNCKLRIYGLINGGINDGGSNLEGSFYGVDGQGVELDSDLKSTGNMYADDFFLNSDIRLKKDIFTLKSKKLSPKRWTWKKSGNKDFGFIAQYLEKDFPEVVITGKDGFKKVAYNKITAINSARINELEDEVNELKSKIELIMKNLK